MNRLPQLCLVTILGLALLISPALAAGNSKGAQRLTKEALKAMLEDQSLVIIDVRPKAQWDASESKLPGAVNEDPFEAEEWSKFYSKDMTVVLY
jgi:hypothetical protein